MIDFNHVFQSIKFALHIAYLLSGSVSAIYATASFSLIEMMHRSHEPIFVLYALLTFADYIRNWRQNTSK